MQGNHVYKRLGEGIISVRRQKGLSQEKLAMVSEVDRTYLGLIEQGKTNPSFRTLFKLARAMKVRVSTLLKKV